MNLYKELQSHLTENQDLADRLATPLRTTSIEMSKTMFYADRLPSGGTPPETLLSEDAAWSPAWQIDDEIIQLQEETETNEENEHSETTDND